MTWEHPEAHRRVHREPRRPARKVYTPAEAERLVRGLLTGSPDVLLLGVKPGKLEGQALAREMGSPFAYNGLPASA